MRSLVLFLASAGYVGYIPIASGTFGSLVAIPLFFGFDALRNASLPLYLLTYVAAVAAACWIAGQADAYLQEHDSHKIVIDEVVGYLGATLFLGGYDGPFAPGPWWLLLKAYAIVFFMMWMRWTYPRLRFDQLMSLAWKFLIPVALVWLVGTALVLARIG